jgi:hypothetical protein
LRPPLLEVLLFEDLLLVVLRPLPLEDLLVLPLFAVPRVLLRVPLLVVPLLEVLPDLLEDFLDLAVLDLRGFANLLLALTITLVSFLLLTMNKFNISILKSIELLGIILNSVGRFAKSINEMTNVLKKYK